MAGYGEVGVTSKAWRAVFDLVVFLSVGGFMVHAIFGNPWAAGTHVFIGTVAALLRGVCDE